MKLKLRCVTMLLVFSMCLMTGCAVKEEKLREEAVSKENSGQVYYLNSMTEFKKQWEDLAQEYTEQTGTKVKVVTAAENQYEATLKSEMEKESPPTIFGVNGYNDMSIWADSCYDLRGSALFKNLYSTDFSLRGDNGEALAVAYATDSYGIIYNKDLLSEYCSLEGAVINSADEIKNFDTLKAVTEDIQEKREVLGIKGAFTSFGLEADSVDRFTLQLANVPVYYELKGKGVYTAEDIAGEYLGNLKEVWDMYMDNSTCEAKEQVAKTLEDAVEEFSHREAVFLQGNTKVYEDVVKEGMVGDDALGMLPLYIGIEGEESQGLCTGTESYWCINSKAKEEDISASVAFLEWVITSGKGKEFFGEEMGLNAPFATFSDEDKIQNPLSEIGDLYIEKGYVPVTWYLNSQTDSHWCDAVATALGKYTEGTAEWSSVADVFVSEWAG